MFQILTPDTTCIFCKQTYCEHQDLLLEKQYEFLASEYPVKPPSLRQKVQNLAKALTGKLDESLVQIKIPQTNVVHEQPLEEYESDPELEAQYLKRQRILRLQGYLAILLVSAIFVGSGGALIWWAMHTDWINYPAFSIKRLPTPQKTKKMSPSELIERFDKNGDGVFSRDDFYMLTSHEKLILINQGFIEHFDKDK